jgi:DUF1680 family protein
MNVSRLVASVGGYFLSTSSDGLAFHLYGGFSSTQTVAGTEVQLRETSNYPWSGAIAIEIDPATAAAFDVKLRIPGWARTCSLTVNGEKVTAAPVNGYVTVRRTWQKGDKIALDLPMEAERVYANPGVIMDIGRVALRRGPLVYCLEEADNAGGAVQRLKLPRNAALKSSQRADLFGGAVTISASARAIDPSDFHELYRTSPPKEADATLTALPYYLWANRGKGSMVVWIPEA